MAPTAAVSPYELSDKLLDLLKDLEEIERSARQINFKADPQNRRQHIGSTAMAIVADRISTAKQVLQPCAVWAETASADLAAEAS